MPTLPRSHALRDFNSHEKRFGASLSVLSPRGVARRFAFFTHRLPEEVRHPGGDGRPFEPEPLSPRSSADRLSVSVRAVLFDKQAAFFRESFQPLTKHLAGRIRLPPFTVFGLWDVIVRVFLPPLLHRLGHLNFHRFRSESNGFRPVMAVQLLVW